jgi:hypothetical protein
MKRLCTKSSANASVWWKAPNSYIKPRLEQPSNSSTATAGLNSSLRLTFSMITLSGYPRFVRRLQPNALLDRVGVSFVEVSDPQFDPQKASSYTTFVVLGVPHGFVSRRKTLAMPVLRGGLEVRVHEIHVRSGLADHARCGSVLAILSSSLDHLGYYERVRQHDDVARRRHGYCSGIHLRRFRDLQSWWDRSVVSCKSQTTKVCSSKLPGLRLSTVPPQLSALA